MLKCHCAFENILQLKSEKSTIFFSILRNEYFCVNLEFMLFCPFIDIATFCRLPSETDSSLSPALCQICDLTA